MFMICINCGAKIPDQADVHLCPHCGAPLNNGPSVSDDTKVNWKDHEGDTKVNWMKGENEAEKTVILPDFGEGMPVPDTEAKGPASSNMKTNPQMEFTAKDFAKFGEFDTDGSNPYGIEMPGKPGKTEKNAAHLDSYNGATVVLPREFERQDSTMVLPRTGTAAQPVDPSSADWEREDGEAAFSSSAYYQENDEGDDPQRSYYRENREDQTTSQKTASRRQTPAQEKEKYFPNGFLQEHPDREPPRRKHRIGILDVLIFLIGLAGLGLCAVIFRNSGGLELIRQFAGGDMNLIMENIDDITYFVNNLDVTWRLYYEIAALVILTIAAAIIFIILHSFVKNIAVGILKGVLLLVTGIGMLILCIGYGLYYLITVGGGSFLVDAASGGISSSGMVAFAGIAVIAAAVLWFIYMCLWGFTSFFKGFHVASMALLSLGFVFAFLLMLLNLAVSWKVCSGVMPRDALYELMSTPALVALFMFLSMVASLEDFLAKRVIE